MGIKKKSWGQEGGPGEKGLAQTPVQEKKGLINKEKWGQESAAICQREAVWWGTKA